MEDYVMVMLECSKLNIFEKKKETDILWLWFFLEGPCHYTEEKTSYKYYEADTTGLLAAAALYIII